MLLFASANLRSGGGTNYSLTALAGTYSLTGGTASLKVARSLTANAGTYSYTGGTAVLKANRKITANAGSYSLSGGSASLVVARKITANAGTYSLVGGTAVLKAGRNLTALAGSYSVVGESATLTKTAAGGINYSLTALAGTYLLTGGSATLDWVVAPTKAGGDDYPGWNRAAWKKKKSREDAIDATIEATYRKVMGLEPDPVVVAEVKQKISSAEVKEITKPYGWEQEARFLAWVQEQILAVQKRQQEDDDEEALLLLI